MARAKTTDGETATTTKKTRKAPSKAAVLYDTIKDKVIMSVEEAAVFLGLKRSFLDNRRREGGGPNYSKLGNRIRYGRADLIAWVDSLKHNGAIPAAA